MRFGSVCSGIEAASVAWEPLGWQAAWFSEIEKFPSELLAQRYPGVKNLGDMRFIAEKIRRGSIEAPEIIVGGTPCQSWSVAGKREGRDDPRGELTFSFLKIVEAATPRFVVWENVPGIVSSDNGVPFCEFLDGLIDLGYLLNCDILDAQFFGLAQRRRRVFVVCQHASFLMKEKSNTSSTIGAIAVLGILRDILAGRSSVLEKSQENLDAKCKSVLAGLRRKTQCFLVQSGDLLQKWLSNLAEEFLSAATERECWELSHGRGAKTAANSNLSAGTQLSVFQELAGDRERCLNTLQSWKSALADLFQAQKSFTTLTELKAITDQRICTYAEILHTIGWFIYRSKNACPHLLKLESLYSILMKEFMSYARQSDEPLFRGERIYGFWDDFAGKAMLSAELIASAREGFDPTKVLFEFDGLRRDSAPSREAAEVVAATIDASAGRRRGSGMNANQIVPAELAGALMARMGRGFNGQEAEESQLIVVHGTQDPCVSNSAAFALGRNNGGENAVWGVNTHTAYTLDGANGQAVAFAENSRAEVRLEGGDGQIVGTLSTGGGKPGQGTPTIAGDSGVRRLTPEECEALQGFPRGYTAITTNGKPAADSPRYRALGNSMAVSVMHWIGKRISQHLNNKGEN